MICRQTSTINSQIIKIWNSFNLNFFSERATHLHLMCSSMSVGTDILGVFIFDKQYLTHKNISFLFVAVMELCSSVKHITFGEVVVRGCARSYAIVHGRTRSYMVVHGRTWSYMVVHDRTWSYMVAFLSSSHFRL